MRRNCKNDYCRQRTGSILLVTTAILFCMFLFALGYSRFLSHQSDAANRIGKKEKLSELAAALATLTAHKLKYSAQLNNSLETRQARPAPGSAMAPLYDYLSQPLSRFESEKHFPMPLEEDDDSHFALLLEQFWQAAGYGDELEESITISVMRDDFTQTGAAPAAYTRNKNGNIRITVNLTIIHSESYSTSLDFHYSCPLRVASAHVPVLSKYNLYIENARLGSGEFDVDYNQVSVTSLGNIAETRTTAQPLVLNNDGRLKLQLQTEFRNFVEDQRGLVYLGGNSPIALNLARSDVVNLNSGCGEEFQFFRRLDFDGIYPVHAGNSAENGRMLISFLDKGVSDGVDAQNQSFYRHIESGFVGLKQVQEWRMQFSSIFRLFGQQGYPSPTLVQGNVLSQYLTIAIMKSDSGKPGKPLYLSNLSYAPPMMPDAYYYNCIALPEYSDLQSAFGLDNSPASFKRYLTQYSSRVNHRPYNQGLGFIHSPANPDAYSLFSESDLLSRFVKSSAHDATHKVPGVFADVYPEVADLKTMSAFAKGFADAAMVSHSIDNEAEPDAMLLLKRQGLLSQNRLAADGWVSFSSGITINRQLEYMSSGGIIVENGDLIVEAPVIPAGFRDDCLLYLVTLNGNVIFKTPPDARVQAAIIAFSDTTENGQVIFRSPPDEIKGALAMKKLVRNSAEAKTFQGTDLVYFTALAAKPAGSDGISPDSQLLTFSFGPLPQEIR
ncbi:MAG: hypothetical protein CVV41_16760 [Candidatus Riflebacteria bacterium HGW-Riflebacteria-1]|nr:MAG: hypothetical protein CVV41_16760 [Candidatus Riflebacteria bacterium HGW-Riflebacteria-1]